MIESLITSKTRINLLLKFFLNPETKGYLRNLETEFGESTNAIRIELNRFEKAGLLNSEKIKNKKYFSANTSHPLYNDINSILLKYTGLDNIILKITNKIGNLEKVYISGDIALGRDSKIIELIIIAKNLDIEFLEKCIKNARIFIKRKIKYTIYPTNENINKVTAFLLWEK